MGNMPTPERTTEREWTALGVGLVALGVVELGRRRVWLAFEDANPLTGLELIEAASLPKILLIGLAVTTTLFALGLGMSKASIRGGAGVVLAITGGGLAVATFRAANALPVHSVIADGWRRGPFVAAVAAVVALLSGGVLARLATPAKHRIMGASAVAICAPLVGFLAPVSAPSVGPEIVDGFAFHTGGERTPRTGSDAADAKIRTGQVIVVDGEPVLTGATFWEIEDGRVFRTHQLVDDDGDRLLPLQIDQHDGRIFVWFVDQDERSRLRVLSADDYATIGEIDLGQWSFVGVTPEGTVLAAGPDADGQRVHRSIENIDGLLAGEAADVEFGELLPPLGASIVAVDERNGSLTFVVSRGSDLGVWRGGEYWSIYDVAAPGETATCGTIAFPDQTEELAKIATFDAEGRALMLFQRFDETLDQFVTDLYVADLEDGSVRTITVQTSDVPAINVDDGRVFLVGDSLVEILDYEARLAGAPVLAEPLTTCDR